MRLRERSEKCDIPLRDTITMSQLTVHKLDHNGVHVWQYPARELARDAHSVRLEAFFSRGDIDLGFSTFARGDRFIEYFYNDRWYNIFAVHAGNSERLKGWYCNICRPAYLGETEIRCEDLALDLWAEPEGEMVVLDEAEFAALPLTPGERENSLRALHALQQMARDGRLPR